MPFVKNQRLPGEPQNWLTETWTVSQRDLIEANEFPPEIDAKNNNKQVWKTSICVVGAIQPQILGKQEAW